MLTEVYIEALLVDEDLADRVWEDRNAVEVDDQTALLVWALTYEAKRKIEGMVPLRLSG